jgi:hypothetical protein
LEINIQWNVSILCSAFRYPQQLWINYANKSSFYFKIGNNVTNLHIVNKC